MPYHAKAQQTEKAVKDINVHKNKFLSVNKMVYDKVCKSRDLHPFLFFFKKSCQKVDNLKSLFYLCYIKGRKANIFNT